MFFGDILSIENVCLDIRGNLLTLNSSVVIIGYSSFNLIFIRSFIACPLAVGALNCSSLGGAGLRRSHKTEEVLCAP